MSNTHTHTSIWLVDVCASVEQQLCYLLVAVVAGFFDADFGAFLVAIAE